MFTFNSNINETLIIGNKVTVTILDIKGTQVKIGVSVPKDIKVQREEIYIRIQKEKRIIEIN